MGRFISITAFQTNDTSHIENGIVEYCTTFDVTARLLAKVEQSDQEALVKIYSPKKGWCVVVWPKHFGVQEIGIAQALSATLKILVSTVHVHDDDFWLHNFFSDGTLLDDYCSVPNYWDETQDVPMDSINDFKTNAQAVAQSVGIEISEIEGYYRPIIEDKEYGKVHQNDDYELDDVWVFVDFWKRLGIEYSGDMTGLCSAIDLDDSYESKLP